MLLNSSTTQQLQGLGWAASTALLYPNGLCGRANDAAGLRRLHRRAGRLPRRPRQHRLGPERSLRRGAHPDPGSPNGTSILPTWLVRTLAGRQHRRDRAGLRACGLGRRARPAPRLPITVLVCASGVATPPAGHAYYRRAGRVSGLLHPARQLTHQPPWPRRNDAGDPRPGDRHHPAGRTRTCARPPCPNWQRPRRRRRLRLPRRRPAATRPSVLTAGSRSTPAAAVRLRPGAVLEDGHLPSRLRLRDAQPLRTLGAPPDYAGRRLQLRHRQQHVVPHRRVGEVLPQWLQDRRIGREGEPASGIGALQRRRPVHLGWFLEGVAREADIAGPSPAWFPRLRDLRNPTRRIREFTSSWDAESSPSSPPQSWPSSG